MTGPSAEDADFDDRLRERDPARDRCSCSGLAFVLLRRGLPLACRLAAAMIGLNLLSLGATYGILSAVFQHEWAEGLLGFQSNGLVTTWLPLFAFVILFGLSMDYTILVLERMREARRNGRSAREAAAEGVAATGGTVTSAALVMVAVFAIFASLRMVENKQLGVGLASAILIDATLVRGIAMPAVVTLLGDRGLARPAAAPARLGSWASRVRLDPAPVRCPLRPAVHGSRSRPPSRRSWGSWSR